MRNAPLRAAAEIEKLSQEQLASQDPEVWIDRLFDATRVREFDGDLDDLKRSHDGVLSPNGQSVRVALTQPGLTARLGPLLQFAPSSWARIDLHIEKDDSAWFESTQDRLSRGDLDLVINNIRSMNKDIRSQDPLLRTHISNIVHDRIGKAKKAQADRETKISNARAAGIRLREQSEPPPELAPSPSSGPRGAAVVLRPIVDPSRHAAAIQLLEILERKLNTLLDTQELDPNGTAIVEDDALPLIKALRRLLETTSTDEVGRQETSKSALVTVGKVFGVIMGIGRTAGGLAGLAKTPDLVKSGQDLVEYVIGAIELGL